MFHLKLLFLWSTFLTFLAIFSSISISIITLLPGLILMWLLYYFFYLGSIISIQPIVEVRSHQYFKYLFFKLNISTHSFLIAIAYAIFCPFYVKFYTGGSLSLMLLNFANGVSNYNAYQEYFTSESLSEFSLGKLPYILLAGCFKFLFLWTLFRIIGYKKYISIIEKISLLIMFFVVLVISISRGTSFELFELFTVSIFSLLIRNKFLYQKKWFTIQTQIFILVLVVGLVFIFGNNIESRGYTSEFATNELYYNSNALLSKIFPLAGLMSFQLSGYFLFGIFFTSTVIDQVWFNSFSGFFSMLLPNGTRFFFENSLREMICGSVIDCGASWIPDLIIIVSNLGLISLFFILFILGALSRSLYNQMINGNLLSAILLYFIFIFLISLPVGNFISSSSANVLAILISVIMFFFRSKFKIN